jgi:hypothetical protein
MKTVMSRNRFAGKGVDGVVCRPRRKLILSGSSNELKGVSMSLKVEYRDRSKDCLLLHVIGLVQWRIE